MGCKTTYFRQWSLAPIGVRVAGITICISLICILLYVFPLCRFIWFPFHVQNKTYPRLELCGSVLIGNWMSRIRGTLREELEVIETNAWVDTTIAFNWLVVRHMIFKVLCQIGSIKYNSCCRNFSGIIYRRKIIQPFVSLEDCYHLK